MEWRSKKEEEKRPWRNQSLVRLMLLFYFGLQWHEETTSRPGCDPLHENGAEKTRISRAAIVLE